MYANKRILLRIGFRKKREEEKEIKFPQKRKENKTEQKYVSLLVPLLYRSNPISLFLCLLNNGSLLDFSL